MVHRYQHEVNSDSKLKMGGSRLVTRIRRKNQKNTWTALRSQAVYCPQDRFVGWQHIRLPKSFVAFDCFRLNVNRHFIANKPIRDSVVHPKLTAQNGGVERQS